MNPLGHDKFILQPISSIIAETTTSCNGIGWGMETYPLALFVLQSTYLHMTGALEQKLKCMCWEVASVDYDFRYKLLQEKLGECSNYDDKKKLFKKIYKCLSEYGTIEFTTIEKKVIAQKVNKDFQDLLAKSPFAHWFQKQFNLFKSIGFRILINQISIDKLPNGNIEKVYCDYVHRYRNRFAHNLTSYQLNMPTLSKLQTNNEEEDNYFRMLCILVLIDEIYIALYKKFVEIRSTYSY